MECSAPPPLSDDQITAALDEAAGPEVRAHLASCMACAARLERARLIETRMRDTLTRWDCPSPQRLADYHLGVLAGDADRAIARHLAICASCAEEIESLRLFLSADAPKPAPTPPPSPARAPRPQRGPLLARLLPRAAAALRGGGAGMLQAAAGDATIFLDVRPAGRSPGQVDIQGQIVDDDQDRWAGALAELRQGGALQAIAEVDDLGTFSFGPVPAAIAELRITPRQGRTVAVRDLDLNV